MGKYSSFDDHTEREILSCFVSQPYGDVFVVYDTLSPQDFATCVSRFSRTHEPFQQRLIQQIENQDIPFDISGIENYKAALALMLHSEHSGRKTIEKYAQGEKHFAMKELASVRMVLEHIPTTTVMQIVNHPLIRPLSQSSRYLPFDSIIEGVVSNRNLDYLPFGDELIEKFALLSPAMQRMKALLTKQMREFQPNLDWAKSLVDDKITNERARGKLEADINFSVLDNLRYLCPSIVPFSFGFASEVRTLEKIITQLITSPSLEDVTLGKEMHAQLRKTYPVLFGEQANIQENSLLIEYRQEMGRLLPVFFDFEKDGNYKVTPRFNPIFIDFTKKGVIDIAISAALCWETSLGSFMQYYNELSVRPELVKQILALALKVDNFEPIHSAFEISFPMFETLMDFGADRDLRRNRNLKMMAQPVSPLLGYESTRMINSNPKALRIFNETVSAFSDIYNKNIGVMRERKTPDMYVLAQEGTLFANRVRRLLSMTYGQAAYMARSRSTRHGHESYRSIAWDIDNYLKEHAPLFALEVKADRVSYPPELTNGARKWNDENIREK